MSSTTQELLDMVTALRHRLELAQDSTAGDADRSAMQSRHHPPHRLESLREKLRTGEKTDQKLQLSINKAAADLNLSADTPELPSNLSARALRLLQQAREILHRLRQMADDPLLSTDEQHPAAVCYQDAVLLADLVARTIQTLPAPMTLQLRLASGIDVLMALLNQRAAALELMLDEHKSGDVLLEDLKDLLRCLRNGNLRDWNGFFALAENIAQEAVEGKPLRFSQGDAAKPPHFVAAHCLTTARVAARVAREDDLWRTRLLQPIVAALVHDVGMLAVPPHLLAQTAGLTEEQLPFIEKHCQLGARWVAKVQPELRWLVDAARSHHERPDGLGYPMGLVHEKIDPLVRLLSVCDVYAALCCDRPHRAAIDTAAALRETTQLGEQFALDGEAVEMLQRISAYPVGTAVELSDGSCGIVIAAQTHDGGTRWTINLLADSRSNPCPFPMPIDVAQGESRSIERSLTGEERRKRFGMAYPQWA